MVMEVGAGQGRFTIELARHVGHLDANDVSRHEITLLNTFAKKEKVKNVKGSFLDLLTFHASSLSKKYQAVTGFFVLHHLPKERLDRVVAELVRVLKPNGVMCFVEPNNTYPFHVVEWILVNDMCWQIEQGIYTNYLGILKRTLEKHGMRLILFRKFGFFPPQIINHFPWVVSIDEVIAQIPLLRQIVCPFVLIAAEKITPAKLTHKE
jgi:ubiquinone/menaquinone biosynthesis C-methylase UbiE